VLEDEVRVAVLGTSTIEQMGDSGMVEPGENLAFTQEALGDRPRVEAGTNPLQRDSLLELSVGAFGEEDLPMPPSPRRRTSR
jgi:hypothetical protein